MKPLSNKVLRQRFDLANPESAFKLLAALRSRRPLAEDERQALWLLLSDNVNDACWKLYGKGKRANKRFIWHGNDKLGWYYIPKNQISRRGYDEHSERILILAEHLKSYKPRKTTAPPEEAVRIAMFAYKRRFLWLEIIRQYAERGFNISRPGVKFPTILGQFSYFEQLLHPERNIDKAMERWHKVEWEIWRQHTLTQAANPTKKITSKPGYPTKRRAMLFRAKLEEYVQLTDIVYHTISWDALGERHENE